MRVGLVLGAGGSVGVAYHGAILSALSDASGWDPRHAEVIVGTSAGSITAAMLRAGLPAADLRAISEGSPLSPEGARLADIGRPHRPRPAPSHFLSMRPMADPAGVVRAITHPHAVPPAALLAALMPVGRVPTESISSGINAVFASGWPQEPLWLTAVGLRDGRRVVFGRPGAPQAKVGDAVAASCAIPGYFRPVTIGGRRYVDGGVRSFVNLDVVSGLGLDLVVVSSPMTSASPWPASATSAIMRQPLRARLHSEVAALRRSGTAVMAVEPGRSVAAAMGFNPMDARSRGRVSLAAYASTRRWLSGNPEGRKLVGLLARSARPGADSGAVAV
jgi:NTE family protein